MLKLDGWLLLLLLGGLSYPCSSAAYFDATHVAMAQAAGYDKWYNAAAADMVKLKLRSLENKGTKLRSYVYLESPNHYYNTRIGETINSETVQRQIANYNNPFDKKGHLYGAIIASLQAYNGRQPGYELAFCAHYIADLSQPLHHFPYVGWSGRENHLLNDGVVNQDGREVIRKNIQQYMRNINLHASNRLEFFQKLTEEIARIANDAIALGWKLKKRQHPVMTRQEAYRQLAESASLLRAILQHHPDYGKNNAAARKGAKEGP